MHIAVTSAVGGTFVGAQGLRPGVDLKLLYLTGLRNAIFAQKGTLDTIFIVQIQSAIKSAYLS